MSRPGTVEEMLGAIEAYKEMIDRTIDDAPVVSVEFAENLCTRLRQLERDVAKLAAAYIRR